MIKKCMNCKYVDYCGGLSDERREACTSLQTANPRDEEYRENCRRWGEMSYYQRTDRRNTPSMRERLRSGE